MYLYEHERAVRMRNRKWIILALVAVISMIPLVTSTGVTESAFFEPETGPSEDIDLKYMDDASLPETQTPAQTPKSLPAAEPEIEETDLTITVETESSAPVTADSGVADTIAQTQVETSQVPEGVQATAVQPEPPAPETSPAVIVDIYKVIEEETITDVSPTISEIEAASVGATDTRTKTQVETAQASVERQIVQASDFTVEPDVRVLRQDVKDVANARVDIIGKTGSSFETAVVNFQGIRLNAAIGMVNRAAITLYDALYKLGAPVPEYRLSTWILIPAPVQ